MGKFEKVSEKDSENVFDFFFQRAPDRMIGKICLPERNLPRKQEEKT